MTANKKTIQIGVALTLTLLFFSGCATSRNIRNTGPTETPSRSSSCTQMTYQKISSSAPVRPPWSLVEPLDENGLHYLVGMSSYHATERDAREEAMNHARKEFAKYTGVEVKDLSEISRVVYGQSSGILDPTIAGKSQSTQQTDSLVRRTRAREWYFEKLIQNCRGTDRRTAYQYWVLAEVPAEEYELIQRWKADRIKVDDTRREEKRKSAERLLNNSRVHHHKTLADVEMWLAKADPITALRLLQSDWSRIYDTTKQLQSTGAHGAVIRELKAMQREIPATISRIRASVMIDPGRGAALWVSTNHQGRLEIPVWVWNRNRNQLLPIASMPLKLKRRGAGQAIARGRSNREGKVIFRLDRIQAGEYQVSIDHESGALASLNPTLKQAMSAVDTDISIVAYSPDVASASSVGVARLFDGPSISALPVKKIVMSSPRYGETRQGSAFGRRLGKEIERALSKMNAITLIRHKEKLTTRSLNRAVRKRGLGVTDRVKQGMSSPAMQAELQDAEASLEIRYIPEGGEVKVDMRLVEALTGKTVATSRVNIAKSLIPFTLQQTMIPTSALSSLPTIQSKKTNRIELELTTQREDGAVYDEGEKVFFYLAASQDAYLLLIFQGADGQLYQIFPNPRSENGYRKANKFIAIPDEASNFDFTVRGPVFGLEQIWAFAASKPFPHLKGSGGLTKTLEQNLTQVVSQLRRHGRRRGLHYGETNTVITTVRD